MLTMGVDIGSTASKAVILELSLIHIYILDKAFAAHVAF